MSRILITMPVWNESLIIAKNLEILSDVCTKDLDGHDWRIEVADNGSQDGTPAIVEDLMPRFPHVSLRRISERGKGRAICASWLAQAPTSDILIFMDADLAADVRAIPRLIGPILRGEGDIVCGSRYIGTARIERSWFRKFVSRTFRLWQKLVLGLPVEDSQCGFKAASSHVVQTIVPRMRETAYLVDAELLAFAKASGHRIVEIPVDWIENRDKARRSAIKLYADVWEFLWGTWRIRQRVAKSIECIHV